MKRPDDCSPRITATCEEKELAVATERTECPTWEVCLPFGGSLKSEGGCVTYEPPMLVPSDGTYGKLTIENGCIVGVDLADIPQYTTAPCAPIPAPCDCDGTGSSPTPSTTAGNLFTYDAAGRPLVKLYVQAGPGISVGGSGLSSDPLVISSTQDSTTSTVVQSGNAAIVVSSVGTATAPVYRVSHAATPATTLTIMGMSFDSYGHLEAYNPPTGSSGVTGIVDGEGIKVTMDVSTGVATISLADPANIITGIFMLGGYNVELTKNRITRIDQSIVVPQGNYQFGDYLVTLNPLGSITDIRNQPPEPPDPTLIDRCVTKKFVVDGENTRELAFTTSTQGAFRISYKANSIPTDMYLFIDNVAIEGDRFPASGSTSFEVITSGVYDIGDHSVVFQSETGFTGKAYVDVLITAVR